MMSNPIVVIGALVIGAVGLSGCSGSAATAVEVNAPAVAVAPSPFQLRALEDGVVDRSEYVEGFANYQGCMAAVGYYVSVLDGQSTIIDMRIPAAAVESGVDDGCYRSEFSAVDEGWQLANQDQRADGVLLDACLEEHDLPVPNTRQEKVDALLSAGVELATCLPEQ
jgi:hypothetical protein